MDTTTAYTHELPMTRDGSSARPPSLPFRRPESSDAPNLGNLVAEDEFHWGWLRVFLLEMGSGWSVTAQATQATLGLIKNMKKGTEMMETNGQFEGIAITKRCFCPQDYYWISSMVWIMWRNLPSVMDPTDPSSKVCGAGATWGYNPWMGIFGH